VSVFVLFARDAFILQVTGVFTRIRSGAAEEGGQRRRAHVDLIYLSAAAAAEERRGP
jgi:hypothetical protein